MHRQTKIVCTLGPATSDDDRLGALMNAGMDVVRINFSHGNIQTHRAAIERVRRVSGKHQVALPIMADLQGPKIRVGLVEEGTILQTGRDFTLTTEDRVGNDRIASTNYLPLPRDVHPGDKILIDDGMLLLEVQSVSGSNVHCRVVEGGALHSRKGINLPQVALSTPSLTEKDREDLAFALEHGVDLIALSFVRSAEDVTHLRAVMTELGRTIPIIAKIERPEAIRMIDDIIAAADGVMVARGDLGVEMSSEEVPLLQKMIIEKTVTQFKPVITATQMLESMISHSRPTRAESSDVANAVLDGTSAVMLSGETSVGKFPVESTETMRRIILAVEANGPQRGIPFEASGSPSGTLTDAVARAAYRMSEQLDAKAIVSVTHSGFSARCVSRYRPRRLILGITDRPDVVRVMNLSWGVYGVLVPKISDTDTTLESIEQLLKEQGWVTPGDRVIYTAGMPLLMRGATNMVKISVVG